MTVFRNGLLLQTDNFIEVITLKAPSLSIRTAFYNNKNSLMKKKKLKSKLSLTVKDLCRLTEKNNRAVKGGDISAMGCSRDVTCGPHTCYSYCC